MPRFSCTLGDEKCPGAPEQLDVAFQELEVAYRRLHTECLRLMQDLQRQEGQEQKAITPLSAKTGLSVDFSNDVDRSKNACDFHLPPQRPEGREESELATFFQEPVAEMHGKGFQISGQIAASSPVSSPISSFDVIMSPESKSAALKKVSQQAPRRGGSKLSLLKPETKRTLTGLSGIGESSGQTGVSTNTAATIGTLVSRTIQHPMLRRVSLTRAQPSKSLRDSQSRTMTRLISAADDSNNVAHGFLFSSGNQTWRRSLAAFKMWYNSSPRAAAITLMEPIMGIFIFIDCILTGISMDTEEWPGWYTVDVSFAIVFSIEMLLKLKFIGFRDMFCSSMRFWSLFDTVIVAMAIVDLFAQFSGSVTVIRVVRLCRLARLVRLVRVPALKELVMLIRGMVGGTRCLFWCLSSLALPIFIVGMIVSQFLKDFGEGELFGTVPSAMFTTMRCMCGDCSDKQGRPLIMQLTRDRGWHYALFYSIFILVTIFGVFNLITAIFIEVTMLAAKSDTNLQRQVRIANDKKFARNIKRLAFIFWRAHSFKVIGLTSDAGNHLRIDASAFEKFSIQEALDLRITQQFYDEVCAVPIAREILDDMGLAVDDMVDLFEMLDVRQSGTLTLIDLISGMNRLRGEATKKDLVALAYMIYSLQEAFQPNPIGTARLTDHADPIVEDVEDAPAAIDSDLPAFFAGLTRISITS